MASLMHPSKMIANKSESNAYKDSANVVRNEDDDDSTEQGNEFHTWEVGEDSTFHQGSVVEEVSTIGTLQKSKSAYILSDSEDEEDEVDESDPTVPNSSRPKSGSTKKEETLENPMSPARVPSKVLELRPLVSEEVIKEKEANIRNLFFKCKDILMAATVFTMANKYEEKVVNGDDMVEEQPVDGINDEECLRENPSKIGIRRNTPKTETSDENNRNKTNTERLLDKYNEEKNSGGGGDPSSSDRAEEKESISLSEDVKLRASAKEEPVRITIPKAGSSSDLGGRAARAEYKPLVHSAMRSASPSVTTTTSTHISTGALDNSANIPQPPAAAAAAASARAASPAPVPVRASSPAGSSAGAGSGAIDSEPSPSASSSSAPAAAATKTKPAVRKTKQSTTSASVGGGIAAQFSADIAKLAAPLGSGLTRHGTKIKTSSSAKLRGEVSASSSNTATFVAGGDVSSLLLSQSTSGGTLMQTNTNSIKPRGGEVSDEAIVNVKITKKEHKQTFAVPSLSEAMESVASGSGANAATSAVAEPKIVVGKSSPVRQSDTKDSKDFSPPRGSESKAETSPTTRESVPSSSGTASNNKGFSRFKNSSSVVDTRGGGGGGVGGSADVRSSNEYHHGIQPYTPTTAASGAGGQSVFQRSYSEPTNLLAEAPSPGSAMSGSTTPRSPAARTQGVGNSIRIAQQMPIAKAVAAGVAPGATYRGFKIPQQARQAINPTAPNTSAATSSVNANKLHGDLSSLEREILKLSASASEDSRPPTARSPRPQPSHSTGELMATSPSRIAVNSGRGGDGYDDSGDEGER